MKILCISWDSDQTNYMENLFFQFLVVYKRNWTVNFLCFNFLGPKRER